MGILLQNGYILNHKGEGIKIDILIEDSKIVKKGQELAPEGHSVIDCTNKWVFPGFIDIHVHLREPGGEAKETIETGTMSAAKGGFTTVACMPNTRPSLDTKERIQFIHDKRQSEGYVNVIPYGAITLNQLGKELTDFAAMKEAGIIGVTDDGVGIQSSYMMKQAMIKAQSLGLPVVAHCEDDTLIEGGAVHDGKFAREYGIKGIPSESESIHIGRDILIAEATGVHYHVCHISTKESVRLVRDGKRAGVSVTAEVSPHHLLLCEDDIPGLDTNFKMNPPLRAREDQEALIEGLLDGTIDIIATDHAPHTAEEKAKSMQLAPFGIVGLETAFPLLYTHFVKEGLLTLAELVDKITSKPADLFQLAAGRLNEGSIADITIVDLELEKEINVEEFASKGKNTPFNGWKCAGWPVTTIVGGKVVWSEKEGFKRE
jgi:dihydroorotase